MIRLKEIIGRSRPWTWQSRPKSATLYFRTCRRCPRQFLPSRSNQIYCHGCQGKGPRSRKS